MIRAADYLRQAQDLPLVDFDVLTRGRGLVIIAPHPDDESLGCGGLIAAACERGTALRLLVLSDGIGSHPNSRRYPSERLRDLRERELLEAAAILGVPDDAVRFLHLPDRHVPVAGPEFERAVEAVSAAIVEIDAGSVFVTSAQDPHCDHQAAFAMARAAVDRRPDVRLHAYPIHCWNLDPETLLDEPAPQGHRLDIGPHLDTKRRAILAHRSQTTDLIDDDPEGFRLAPTVLARFDRPFEIFLEGAP